MNLRLSSLAFLVGIVDMTLSVGYRTNGERRNPCDVLKCEHDSVCMEIISPTKSVSSARCKCNEQYTGSKCQYTVGLKSHQSTSKSVQLEIVLGNTDKNITNNESDEHDLKYTVLYWRNYSNSACAMVPGVKSGILDIKNLEPATRYTFCSVSGIAEFCHRFPMEDTMPPNCVFMETLEYTAKVEDKTFIAPLVLSVLVMLGLCICIVVMIKRKYISCFSKYQPCSKSKKKSDTKNLYMGGTSKKKGDKSRQYLMSMPQRPPPDIVIHAPSSPGRPKHKLSQFAHGYTSTFAAKNESAIPLTTVIEYSQSDNSDRPSTADTSLILHQVESEN